MSDGVLAERDGRLEFYTRLLKPGRIVPTRRFVTMFRAFRLVTFPLGFAALMLIRPRAPWTAAFIMAGVVGMLDGLRNVSLRRLPKTQDVLALDLWRRESAIQESPLYLGVLSIGTAAFVVSGVATMILRREVPLVLVVGCVLFTLGALLAAHRWRSRQRAVQQSSSSVQH